MGSRLVYRNSESVLRFEVRMRLPGFFRMIEDEVFKFLVEDNIVSDNQLSNLYPSSVPPIISGGMSSSRRPVP